MREQKKEIETIKDKNLRQYYIPMGYKVANRLSGNLPALIYMIELRSSVFVHPTLRKIAFSMAKVIEKKFDRYGLKLYLEKESHRFDVGRGKQDIVLKRK